MRSLSKGIRGSALVLSLSISAHVARAQEASPGGTEAPAAAPAESPAAAEAPATAPPKAAEAPPASEPNKEIEELKKRVDEQGTQIEELKSAQDEAAAAAEESAQPQKLNIYGFMDMGFQRAWTKPESPLSNFLNANAATFVIGNLNVYFDAQPIKGWRGLMEVRFTNAPLGNIESVGGLGGTFKRTDTQQIDPHGASLNAPMWGGYTVIERAHIDWMPRQEFNLRVGNFFTPFGIWNVDHGSPTLISTALPQMIVQRMFPIRQTGLMVFGSTMAGPWELGYTATLTNGRQEEANFDFDDDKAFGARVYARNDGKIRSMMGLSFYEGDTNDKVVSITAVQPSLQFKTEESYRYKEWSAGADLSLDIGDSRIRAEAAVRRVKYDPGKRTKADPLFSAGGFSPDAYYSTAYLIWAHQLPWAGIEPFVFGEVMRGTFGISDSIATLSGGVNVHFTPTTMLKTQVTRALFFNQYSSSADNPSQHDTTVLFTRLVLAY
ncbi:MAG TPA: hypothetical protein VFQ35_25330 [Polyangiaceae bacterium]|nr:hypothetical protein [Polyangiaceae bacterium]